MAFSTETKYGYQDGEQFGNWGPTFPIFARVVNNELYAVAREDNPAWAGQSRFGKMFTLSVEWLKGTIFADHPTDADFFADKPNQVEDTSVPGNEFVKSNDTANLLKRPNADAAQTLPKLETEPTKAKDVPVIAATTTTPVPATMLAAVTSVKQMPQWALIALSITLVGAVVGIIIWLRKRNEA
ncbi:hypothetical protein GO755_33355 [Spirosoma sp. HMF4905]|uniref:Uncharacterized protein n=1 Tax=Spirosoma arboris TaxID=2682092 RepID=A0A7K1SMR9_9BACT|nr:hypothetical protein [Spirosoma arboris]MVM34963.1 hypothetical protein [Spirosoma arboris]